MAESRRVQHCRWAQPTLFLAGPLWAAAEDFPWSCDAGGEPRLIDDTRVCRTCDRWISTPPTRGDGRGSWRAWPAPAPEFRH
jgi:hypothetical protein